MSFPRAKRFNEVQNSVPSPTRYDPKLQDRARGFSIAKGSDRERAPSISSDSHSTAGTPFRTPFSSVKKHNCLGASHEKVLPRSIFPAEEKIFVSDNEEISALKTEVINKSETIHNLERQIQDLYIEMDKVRSEVIGRNFEAYQSEIDDLISERDALSTKVSDLNSTISNLELKYNTENKKLVDALEELKTRKDEEEILRIKLETDSKNLLLEKEVLVQNMHELQDNIAQLETFLETEKNKAQLFHDEISKQVELVASLQKKIQELENVRDELNAQLVHLDGKLETCNSEMKKLKADLSKLQDQKLDLERLIATMESDFEDERKHWEIQKETLNEKVDSLNQQIEALIESNLVELESLKMTLDEVKIALQAREQELIDSQKESEINRVHLEDVIISLRESNDLLQKDVAVFKEDLKQHKETIEELNERLEAVKKDKFKEEKAHKEELLQMKEEREKISLDLLKKLEETEKNKEVEIEQLEKNLAEIRNEKEIADQNFSKLKIDFDEKCSKISTLEVENQKLSKKVSDVNKKLKESVKEVEKLNNSMESLKQELKEKHMQELFKLQNEHEKQLLSSMNQHTEELMEKDSIISLTQMRHQQNVKAMQDEFTKSINSLKVGHEELLNRLQNEHVNEMSRICEKHEEACRKLEEEVEKWKANYQEEKTEYEAAMEQVRSLTECIEEKEREIEKMSSQHSRTQERVKNMLEEIKILNNEINGYKRQLDLLRKQFDEERNKNERLSEQLGSLDSELVQTQDDLKLKIEEVSAANDDAAKQRAALHELKLEQLQTRTKLVEVEAAKKTLQADLNAAKEQYTKDLSECVEELAQLKQLCHNYKIAINDTRNSLSAISTRLLESDAEVQRLTQENAILTESREALEQLRDQLLQDAKAKEESVEELQKQLKEVNLEMITLERASLEQVERVSDELIGKLSDFERFAMDNIKHLQDEINQLKTSKSELEKDLQLKTEKYENLLTDHEILKTTFEITGKETEEKLRNALKNKEKLENDLETLKKEKEELLKEVDKVKEQAENKLKEKDDISNVLKQIETRKDFYKYHCQKLEDRLNEAEKERQVAIQDFDQIHGLLNEKETEVQALQGRVADLENLIGPFREQLEQYETERMLIENDREQLKRQHLEHAAKLGHQNHKQKIQHVVKLKAEIFALKEDNKKLQVELKNKGKLVEKLREELGEHPKRLFIGGRRPTSTPFKGKENDSMQPMDCTIVLKKEPKNPLSSPLRNRNQ